MTALTFPPCRSRGAFRAAGWRSQTWSSALERFAALHDLTYARLEALIAVETAPAGAPITVHASERFVARWREAHGDRDVTTTPIDAGFRVNLVETSARGGAGATAPESLATEARIALDSEVGFACLHIASSTPFDVRSWIIEADECLVVLADAVTTAVRTAHAEEALALRVLATVGASAMIVDACGRPRALAGRAPIVDPAFVDPALDRDGKAARRRVQRARPTPGRGRPERFRLIVDPEGRRWIGYSIELPFGEAAFAAGDRMLVAWPIDGMDTPPVRPSVSIDLGRDLGEVFDLSKAEAALAAALAEGDLAYAAKRCGIGYETARTHLKSIFRRIGLKRQSELPTLLTQFAFHAGLRAGLTAAEETQTDPIG